MGCPYGGYTPFEPKPGDGLEFLRGICTCDQCVQDRREYLEEVCGPMILESHRDDLEDDRGEEWDDYYRQLGGSGDCRTGDGRELEAGTRLLLEPTAGG